MNKETLEEVAERLKGKELFKDSNDRARETLSEIKLLPKQETLEEVALKLFPDKSYWIGSGDTSRLYDPNLNDRERWIQGAKWQQEQDLLLHEKEKDNLIFQGLREIHQEQIRLTYSEEEVIDIFSDWFDYRIDEDKVGMLSFKQWFNNFKNK
jgi:hypothetical protein